MNADQLLSKFQENPFFLAPMAGITDSPFRSFMKELGCGIVTTEFISAKGLQMAHEKSQKIMTFEESQHPVGVQIFGDDLQAFRTAAQMVEQAGADFVDINCGCPVSKIIRKGAGAAVLKDLLFLQKILRAVRQAVSIPVSIKIRTGWDHPSRNSHEVVKIAYNEGLIWLTIHGRTRVQGYSGQADWDYIAQVKQQSPLPIIGNGDLTTSRQILQLKKDSGCDGMMIGRGCLKNPWIFLELQNKTQASRNIYQVLNRLRFHLENFYGEHTFLLQYKKFCAWFSSGFPESSAFRRTIFTIKERNQLLDTVENYFHQLNLQSKKNEAYEASLMQGHG